MNLLLASDLHCDADAAARLVAGSRAVDVVVIAGDLCNVHRGLDDMIAILKAVTTPTVLVAGNNETTDELRRACRGWSAARVLHGDGCEVLGVPFFGVGGGIPVTPFGAWSYDFTEEQAEALLAACPANGVLVVHSPPFGVVDVSSRGGHIGSTAVRAAVERVRPKLVACGHVHGSNGRTGKIGPTTVVNAGPVGCAVAVQ